VAKDRVALPSNRLLSNDDLWDPIVPVLSNRYRVLRYDAVPVTGHRRAD